VLFNAHQVSRYLSPKNWTKQISQTRSFSRFYKIGFRYATMPFISLSSQLNCSKRKLATPRTGDLLKNPLSTVVGIQIVWPIILGLHNRSPISVDSSLSNDICQGKLHRLEPIKRPDKCLVRQLPHSDSDLDCQTNNITAPQMIIALR